MGFSFHTGRNNFLGARGTALSNVQEEHGFGDTTYSQITSGFLVSLRTYVPTAIKG